jgi:hypothetical protein
MLMRIAIAVSFLSKKEPAGIHPGRPEFECRLWTFNPSALNPAPDSKA